MKQPRYPPKIEVDEMYNALPVWQRPVDLPQLFPPRLLDLGGSSIKLDVKMRLGEGIMRSFGRDDGSKGLGKLHCGRSKPSLRASIASAGHPSSRPSS